MYLHVVLSKRKYEYCSTQCVVSCTQLLVVFLISEHCESTKMGYRPIEFLCNNVQYRMPHRSFDINLICVVESHAGWTYKRQVSVIKSDQISQASAENGFVTELHTAVLLMIEW